MLSSPRTVRALGPVGTWRTLLVYMARRAIAMLRDQHLLTRQGRHALIGCEDSPEVERIGGGRMQGLPRAAPPDRAEQRHRFGQGILLAVETGHEAPSANVSPRLQRSKHADQIAPGVRLFLADDGPSE